MKTIKDSISRIFKKIEELWNKDFSDKEIILETVKEK